MRDQKRKNRKLRWEYSGRAIMLSLLSAWMLTACGSMGLDGPDTAAPSGQDETVQAANYDAIGDVPEYSGEPYV